MLAPLLNFLIPLSIFGAIGVIIYALTLYGKGHRAVSEKLRKKALLLGLLAVI